MLKPEETNYWECIGNKLNSMITDRLKHYITLIKTMSSKQT